LVRGKAMRFQIAVCIKEAETECGCINLLLCKIKLKRSSFKRQQKAALKLETNENYSVFKRCPLLTIIKICLAHFHQRQLYSVA